jgi:hypothetical protein
MRSYNDALLFKLASEGLSAEDALNLARAMGLVDETTVFATEKTNEWERMLKEGKITVERYTELVSGLQGWLAKLESKEIDVVTNFKEYHYSYSNQDPVGYEPIYEQSQAGGGSVNRGMNYRWQEYGYPGEQFIPSQDGYVLNRSDAADILSKAMQGQNQTVQQPLIGSITVANGLDLETVIAEIENRLARR